MIESKAQLRRRMRAARRALSIYAQRRAARAVTARLARNPQLRRARNIGIYWPMDGEVDIRTLQALFRGKNFFLPVLPEEPRAQLGFRRWHGGALHYRNRYGIPEPQRGQLLLPRLLDLVLLPLVAFDPTGGRLGMGAGLYDRTFAFKRLLPGAGPQLIGVAHQLQCVPRLPVDSWDIPLGAVVTEAGLYRCG